MSRYALLPLVLLCVTACSSDGHGNADVGGDVSLDTQSDVLIDAGSDVSRDANLDGNDLDTADAAIEYDDFYFSNDGDDSAPCSESEPCQTAQRAAEIALSRQTALTPARLLFFAGSYGALELELGGDFESSVLWTAVDPSNRPQFDLLLVECAGEAPCSAQQTFEHFRFERPAGVQAQSVVRVQAHDVTLRDSYVGNVQVFDGAGIGIVNVERTTIERVEVTRVLHAIRYRGIGHIFRDNEIHHNAGTGIGMFCSTYQSPVYASQDILLEGNRLHNQTNEWPDEPGQPAGIHASTVAIRGTRNFTMRGNYIWAQSSETRILGFYDPDCGVSDYHYKDLLFERNIIVDGSTVFDAPGGANLNGQVVARHNTIVGHMVLILDYDGEGSVYENNLVTGNFALVSRIYQDYDHPDAHWRAQHNLFGRSRHPAGTPDPMNTNIEAQIRDGVLPEDYIRTQLFEGYGTRLMDCAPFGNADCSWRPAPSSLACTSGTNGGYVGAIPCE